MKQPRGTTYENVACIDSVKMATILWKENKSVFVLSSLAEKIWKIVYPGLFENSNTEY